MIEIVHVDAKKFNRYPEVLALLHHAFEYMQGRIDPESSLYRLDVDKIVEKSVVEELFIAIDAGQLAGCVFALPQRDYVYLGKLAVRSSYRGRGISRLLVNRVEALAVSLGLAQVEIETRVELLENQRFFEYLGYVKTAENSHPGYDRPTSICYRKTVLLNTDQN